MKECPGKGEDLRAPRQDLGLIRRPMEGSEVVLLLLPLSASWHKVSANEIPKIWDCRKDIRDKVYRQSGIDESRVVFHCGMVFQNWHYST